MDDLIRKEEVMAILQIQKTKLYELIKMGVVPQPKKPSPKLAMWVKSDIIQIRNGVAQGVIKFPAMKR